MAIRYHGSGGDSSSIRGVEVGTTPPTDGQVLKYDQPNDELVYATDATSENATSLQGRALAATAPNDGDAIKWNAGVGQWQPHVDNNSQDATHIQSIPVTTDVPTLDEGLFLDATGSYKPGPVNASQMGGRDVSAAPVADQAQWVFDLATTEWTHQQSAGVLTDGTRSFLKDPDENLGLGVATGLSGKLHAKESTPAISCKIVTESDQGPAAVHVRADTQGTQGAAGYGNFQIWNSGAPKVNIHFNPSGDGELIVNSDGTSNALKGLCLKSDGRSGFGLGSTRIGSNSFGQVADIANLIGSDGNPLQTGVNANTTININSGNGNLTDVLGEGDLIALDSAGATYAHVISVVSDTQVEVSSPLGDGTATQQIKVQHSILNAKLDGGTSGLVLDAGAKLGVGAGRMDPQGALHVSGATETTAIVDSMSKSATLELWSDSQTGTATGADLDTMIQFSEGTGRANKGQICYDSSESLMYIATDGTSTTTKGVDIKDDGRFGLHTNKEKIGNFKVKTIADTATLLGTDQLSVTTTSSGTVITGSANSDFLRDLSEGDEIALSSDPALYSTILEIVSATSILVSKTVGDGTTQTISVKRAIASFFDSSSREQMVLSPTGNLGIGVANPARKIVASTLVGEGNCTIRAQSPDDQAVLSLQADSTGVASGPNKDPSVNFKSGAGAGEAGRIRYVKDYEQLEFSLKDTPSTNDMFTFQDTVRGARFGVRQARGASGLSAKKLPDGQMFDSSSVAITGTSDFSLSSHTMSANGLPQQIMAVGDLVALSNTIPAFSDYVPVMGVGASFFTTLQPIGISGVSLPVWLKPAHFRLEEGTTTEDAFIVDGDGNARVGYAQAGLDARMNINGDISLTDFGEGSAPTGADMAKIYYRSPAGGNDEKTVLLMHFDVGGPHGSFGDSSVGASFRHQITNDGVTIDTSTSQFGTGSAKFDGSSALIIDQMLGTQGEFYPSVPGLTWQMWLRLAPTPISNIQPLCNVYGTATSYQSIVYNQATDELLMSEDVGLGKSTVWSIPNMGITSGGTPIGTGVWFALAFVYEASSNKVYAFVNGNLVGSDGVATSWSNLWSTAALNIGFDRGDSNLHGHFWMDEYAISREVRHTSSYLSPSEPFYAEGIYCWHSGLSAPYRLQPVGS